MSDSEYKLLIQKRGIIKGKLTAFKKYVQEFSNMKDISRIHLKELTLRLQKIQQTFEEFDVLQSSIELAKEATDEQIKEREFLENAFYSCISLGQELIETNSTPFNDAISERSHSPNSGCRVAGVKLPTIKLPIFNGNYACWLEFKDTFKSLIHENKSLNDINKFHYLRASLEGSAQQVINSLEISANNYITAWNLICERFDNKRQLINSHLKALCNIGLPGQESHTSLRNLVDHISKNLRALNNLQQSTENWDTLIIFMFTSKLDSETTKKWEEHRNNIESLPTLTEFLSFLKNRANVLESLVESKPISSQPANIEPSDKQQYKRIDRQQKTFVATTTEYKDFNKCPICSGEHRIYNCKDFNEMTVDQRNAEVSKRRLCINCFRSGHFAHQCRMGPCKICKKRHNSMLHKKYIPSTSNPVGPVAQPISLSTAVANQVLLSTAIVNISNTDKKHKVRVLLDCGSQSSFITNTLKEKLGIFTENMSSLTVAGINNISFDAIERCKLTIEACNNSFKKQVHALVIPNITGNLPCNEIDVTGLSLPQNICLADPQFNHPGPVDVLLGADVFWDIISPEKLTLGLNQPLLQNSKLGWLVVGPVMCEANTKIYCNFSHEVSTTLKKFWELEEVPSEIVRTAEEEMCEAHFVANTYRTKTGRFCVKLPMKKDPSVLGDSYGISRSRFSSLERRFRKQPQVKRQYVDFIKEYETLEHLSVIEKPENCNLLPHHPVLRENNEKTKCRVVFDASAKTSSGFSMNDILMIGPQVQNDIFSILIRFRQHRYVLNGDIAKFYRQILLHESQRNLQVILWRNDESDNLQYLQLNTVTYGTSSASFLSTRCLYQLGKECRDPKIGEIIKNDYYCDDLLTGAENERDLQYIKKSVVSELASACLVMPKLRTNCTQLFQDKCSFDLQEKVELNTECKVLGMKWNPCNDFLMISYAPEKRESCNITKRTILSTSSKIYDPLGLISVCTILFKILLQQLWLEKLDWDEPVPENTKITWLKLNNNLDELTKLQIQRHAFIEKPNHIELHVFSDASLRAYAGCIYTRSVDINGAIHVKLLCAKTKVAPLKQITIPKLELCGAGLASKLCNSVTKALRCNVTKIHYWSDSKIVLAWLKRSPAKLTTFVSHRVTEINELTGNQEWRYVPSAQNPADLASRGLLPSEVADCEIWWKGPAFLSCDETQWPKEGEPLTVEVPEVKNCFTVSTSVENQHSVIDFKRFSNVNRLTRTLAYVIRFIKNIKSKSNRLCGPITTEELKISETKLAILSQKECFPVELEHLLKGEQVHVKSSIANLTPFVDEEGVMRVGGRLENADYNFYKKHPVILDGKHVFCKLLLENEHKRLLHAGPQLLLASVRERYWPIGGRVLARQTFRQCIRCRRMQGKVAQQIMGNLPASRVDPGYVFDVVGTDYAGPFMISTKKGRGAKLVKAYLCIFVCFKTKACHLELVSDLTTEAFILSLRRFISRRGKPSRIYSDNGLNFVGANRELGILLENSVDAVSDFSANEGIEFRFSPAYTPNWGGLWESAVKVAKHHMKKVVGNSHFTFEEITTLFAQIEAVMNSRPLVPLTSDPDDLGPLTPGHFLIGKPLLSLPAPNLEDVNPNRLHRYARLEQARQHFWSRWSKEVIAEMHQRAKWIVRHEDLKPGQIVLIREEQTPPLKWPLGRIHALHPGSDAVTRLVDIKTTKGIMRRSVRKVVPLMDEITA